MKKEKSLKVCFMGGSQAGVIGVLTLASAGHKIIAAVSYFEELSQILKHFKIGLYPSIKKKKFIESLKKSDLLVSVHGREIVKQKELSLPRLGCINIHPYLYRYKGADPVGRALKDRCFEGSVGAHMMTENIDSGKVLVEEFVNVSGAKTVDEIYNKLYPYYPLVLFKALNTFMR